jgi:hypothetical protein
MKQIAATVQEGSTPAARDLLSEIISVYVNLFALINMEREA